jgi:hypothetical protein
MKFCDADACLGCSRAEGTPVCLRHKAQFCMWLASKSLHQPVREALEKLSMDLIEEASAVEKTQAIPTA